MLSIRGLHKTYGDLTAVHPIHFALEPGDVFGFIGSNGAGKTTTIRMLATLLEPTDGTASLNGVDLREDPMQIRRMIGYMPDFFGLYDDVKVWEYLDFFATLYSVPPKQRSEVIDNILEITDLTVKRDALVQTLSRGMQQRLCLARCLVHDPDLLLLDEPASGLDPRARGELKKLILDLSRMGKIIMVSSHILPELADFCNCVGIIEKGKMLAFGPVKEVLRKVQPVRKFEIEVIDRAPECLEEIGRQGQVHSATINSEGAIVMEYHGSLDDQACLLSHLIQRGYKVLSFSEKTANLEHAFFELTTGAVN